MSPTAVSVSSSCMSASPKSKSLTEIAAAVREQHVRRLDVAMDDAVRVSVGEGFEHLGGGLERGGVGRARRARIASRSVRPGT